MLKRIRLSRIHSCNNKVNNCFNQYWIQIMLLIFTMTTSQINGESGQQRVTHLTHISTVENSSLKSYNLHTLNKWGLTNSLWRKRCRTFNQPLILMNQLEWLTYRKKSLYLFMMNKQRELLISLDYSPHLEKIF